MNDFQSSEPDRTPKKELRVLLLVCAGALLVIIVTLFSAVQEHQTTLVARATDERNVCDPQNNVTMPNTLQFILNAQCVMSSGPEIP